MERLISISDSYSAGFAIDSADYFYLGTYYSAGAGDEVRVYNSSGDFQYVIPIPQAGVLVCGQELQSNQGCNDVDCDPDGNIYVSTNGFGGTWPDIVEEGTVFKIAAGTLVIEKYLGYKIDDPDEWDWFRAIAYDGESHIEDCGYTDPTQPPPTGNRLYLDMDFTQFASGGNGPDTIVGFAADCDEDEDGVPDSLDNAPETDNGGLGINTADQQDTDLDMYGNICDGDLNNNGFVNGFDYGLFSATFPPNLYNPVADFDSTGNIDGLDYGLFSDRYNDLPPWY